MSNDQGTAMKLWIGMSQLMGLFLLMLAINGQVLASSPLSLSALIATKGVGCEMTLPNTVLTFRPLQVNKLVGNIKTYQIQPIKLVLTCTDEKEEIQPTLSIQGNTPYQQANSTVFLDGSLNGVGFMLRQSSDNNPISLADFYNPSEALANNGKPKVLASLDTANNYYKETVLWVGLVGPMQPDVIAGDFHATLTINVAF